MADLEARGSSMPERDPSSSETAINEKTELADPVVGQPSGASLKNGGPADEPQVKLVVFEDENDPENPRNWSKLRRWIITLFSALLIVVNTWASSGPTGSRDAIQAKFGVGDEVFVLILSLYLLGYVAGPFVWAPLSERFGRRPIFIASGFCFAALSGGCAASNSFAVLLVLRFLSAALGCAPMTNAGSMLGDVWAGPELGFAALFFAIGPWAGPSFGPLAGGYLERYGWRWIFIVQTIVAGTVFAACVLLLPETYAPRILLKRAKKLRKESGDQRYVSALEVRLSREGNLSQKVAKTLATPFKMLFTELTVALVTVYMSLTYGIIYALFESYPVIFTELRGMSPGLTGVTFLPVMGGCILSIPISYWQNKAYVAAAIEARKSGRRPPPELRLDSARIGGPMTALGLIWLGFAGYKPEVIWVVPSLAGIPIGLGCAMIFRGLQTYLVDFYGNVSASALAGAVAARSLFGAAIPLFAAQMYHGLGVQWASFLLAMLMLIMCPVPWIFTMYGDRIRRHSYYVQFA